MSSPKPDSSAAWSNDVKFFSSIKLATNLMICCEVIRFWHATLTSSMVALLLAALNKAVKAAMSLLPKSTISGSTAGSSSRSWNLVPGVSEMSTGKAEMTLINERMKIGK